MVPAKRTRSYWLGKSRLSTKGCSRSQAAMSVIPDASLCFLRKHTKAEMSPAFNCSKKARRRLQQDGKSVKGMETSGVKSDRYTPSNEKKKKHSHTTTKKRHRYAHSINKRRIDTHHIPNFSPILTSPITHQNHGSTLKFNLIPIAANSTSKYLNTPGTATCVTSSPPAHFWPDLSSQQSFLAATCASPPLTL
jgi:hypothetical protein